ncbi:rossman fold oxidoreductase [Phakopsora pachyrhizi]|uniref:Rossman fold oxidoreductase n=1 Tax=Phakopsora pachyrhizi TaxID=170000 RepID=A0AAV0ANT6_PHAPC|nr:rossman fold oxidoreductase [Phakopsora pachyrhizi]
MANLAVVQGSSQGIGLSITKYLLRNSNLNVVSTTSKDPLKVRRRILEEIKEDGGQFGSDRAIENIGSRLVNHRLDVRDELSIERVSRSIRDRFGQNLRFLVNVSGVLLAEKSITKVNKEDMEKTFSINTMGHILVYKHFFSLLPTRSQIKQNESIGIGGPENDPAKGLIKPNLNILLSFSARVGSITDNNLGGWYSYRSSKTAINQTMVTLQKEIDLKKSLSPTITVAYHPGTVLGTELSKQFVEPTSNSKKLGFNPPEKAVEKLFDVLGDLGPNDGASFLDYQGKRLPW